MDFSFPLFLDQQTFPSLRGTPLAKGVVLVPDTCYILRKEPGSDPVDSPSN